LKDHDVLTAVVGAALGDGLAEQSDQGIAAAVLGETR
jgi:hypothetical protein